MLVMLGGYGLGPLALLPSKRRDPTTLVRTTASDCDDDGNERSRVS